MIDFDRFWAEPGTYPGMTREQAEAQLRQMGAWLESMPGASGKFDTSLVPGMTAAPGVTAGQVAAWEKDHGVPLPQVLREALMRQDGGCVRETQFRVLPLAEIESPDEEFWEWASYEEKDVPDRQLIFQFAEDEFGGTYFFRCAARGREQADPQVLVHYHDPGDLDLYSKSITALFDGMLQAFYSPSVDWSETDKLDVIARETIDLSAIHGGPAKKDQVLGRQGGSIVLFEHERWPAGETLAKTSLPERLSRHAAMLQPCRPAPISTYSLMLQPENTDAIERLEAQRTSDGRWKNSTSRGTPICVLFESADRSRLEALRRDLVGKKAADRAQAQEDKQQKLQAKLAAIPPEQRQAAMLQTMLQMRERFAQMYGAGPLDPTQLPPEAAGLRESLQQKLREIEERAKAGLGKHPLGPEILRAFGEINPEIGRLLGKGEEPGGDD